MRFLELSHEDCLLEPGGCPASCSRVGPGDLRLHLGVTRRGDIQQAANTGGHWSPGLDSLIDKLNLAAWLH